MGNTKAYKTNICEISIKVNSFDVPIGIKIPFFRVSVTIGPGRFLLTVRYHELFDYGQGSGCLYTVEKKEG